MKDLFILEISGNCRDKAIRYLNNRYLNITNIYVHKCYVDPNFKEIINKSEYGYKYSNGARYGQYLDFNRYSYEKFLENTKYTYPVYIEFNLKELLIGLLRLSGWDLNNLFECKSSLLSFLKSELNKCFPLLKINSGFGTVFNYTHSKEYVDIKDKILNGRK